MASTFLKRSVLIADDEPLMSGLLARLMKGLGYHVVGTAANGLEALEMTRALRPDFLICDLAMPEMSGLEAAQRILAEREIPIIICSGLVATESRERALQMGVRAFVLKPFTLEQLKRGLLCAGVALAGGSEACSLLA